MELAAHRTWLRPLKAFFFVIGTLVVWFIFQLLARMVITCLPGGDACVLRSSAFAPVKSTWPVSWFVWFVREMLGWNSWTTSPALTQYLYNSKGMDSFVSFVLLALSLWPTILFFYGRREPDGHRSER